MGIRWTSGRRRLFVFAVGAIIVAIAIYMGVVLVSGNEKGRLATPPSNEADSLFCHLVEVANRLKQPRGEWDWDIEKDELLWSTEVFQMFGVSPDQFGGTYRAFLDFVHPEDRQFVRDSVEAALVGAEYSVEHRIILPSGEVRLVHERAEVFFDEQGRPHRMTGTVHDITDYGRNSEIEWRNYILAELRVLCDKVETARIDIATLKTEARMWGAGMGAVVSFVFGGAMLLINRRLPTKRRN